MSNPTPVIDLTDDLAAFLARVNQFGEANQLLVQQKRNKSPGDGITNPGFPASESTAKSVAQWPNMVDDYILAMQNWQGGVGSLGAAAAAIAFTYAVSVAGAQVIGGTGDPDGAVTAPVGSLFLRTDGGAGTTIYTKESGTGNTGWVAVSGGGGGASALAAVLAVGNTTGGTDISVTTGDKVIAPAELTLEWATKMTLATTLGASADVFTGGSDPSASEGAGSIYLKSSFIQGGNLFVQMLAGGGTQWRGVPGGCWKEAPTVVGPASYNMNDGEQVGYDPSAGLCTINLPDPTTVPDCGQVMIFNRTTNATAANLDLGVQGGGNMMHPITRAIVTGATAQNAAGRCFVYQKSTSEGAWILKGLT